MADSHASDSAVQRDAEFAILDAVAARVGVALERTSVRTSNGGRVEIDGSSADNLILVEAYARVGCLRGAQPKKLATDALKLVWIGQQVGAARLILAVADERVEAYLRRPTAWLTQALIDLNVEVICVDLGPETTAALEAAQVRQYR